MHLAPAVLRMAVIALMFPLAIVPWIIRCILGFAIVTSMIIKASQYSNVDTFAVFLSSFVVEPIIGIIIRAGAVPVGAGTGINLG